MANHDQDLYAEIESSCRALARRVRSLVQSAEKRGADRRFVERLGQIADSLTGVPRMLGGSPALAPNIIEPLRVAKTMTSAFRNNAVAPQAAPPMELPSLPGMLRGSNDSVPLDRLFEFIAVLGKTGVLWVTTREETFTFQFKDGAVVHAYSNNTPPGQRLGEILVEQSAITDTALDRFLSSYRPGRNGLFGSHLLDEKIVTQEQLATALEQQIRQLTERMLNAERATFNFRERAGTRTDENVKMSVAELLFDISPLADG